MIKFLPLGVLVILILSVSVLYFYRQSQTQIASQKVSQQVAEISGKSPTNSFAPISYEDRFKTIEDAIVIIAKKTGTQTTVPSSTAEERLKSLEDNVAAIKLQLSQLQGNSVQNSTTSQSTAKRPPSYIPLDWNASSNNQDWATITGQTVTIDTNDYPGYTSVQFEAKIMNYQGNGTCFARMLDPNGNAIFASEVSANGINYTWVTSTNFNLTEGKKTYGLQLKTNTGYAAQIADARLKVNF